MNKIKLLALSVSVMLTTQVNANTIQLKVEDLTASHKSVVSEIKEMSGSLVNKQTGDQALYSNSERSIVILDSDNIVNNNSGLNKSMFDGVQSIIIVGERENNNIVSQELLGYGVSDDYLVITGVDNPESRNVIHFDNEGNSSNTDVARALIKAAM